MNYVLTDREASRWPADYDVIAAEVHRKALENLTNEMAITLDPDLGVADRDGGRRTSRRA